LPLTTPAGAPIESEVPPAPLLLPDVLRSEIPAGDGVGVGVTIGVGVGTGVGVGVGAKVGAGVIVTARGLKATSCPTFEYLPPSTAVMFPVAPVDINVRSATFEVVSEVLTIHCCVIPVGVEMVVLDVAAAKNNSRSLAVVVVIEGAVTVDVLSLYCPLLASIGEELSTPV